VRTVEGGELFAVSGLKPKMGTGSAVFLLRIPTEFLPTGDYQIELQGISADSQTAEVARYNFRVIKNATRR